MINQFRHRRILVVGDLMLDRYICGTVSRISPEAPVPVVQVVSERNVPGGAANVARNVQTLGGEAVLSGILGADAPGELLLNALKENNVSDKGIVRSQDYSTILKIRILAERQQVVRVDWDGNRAVPASAQASLTAQVCRLAEEVDGIIIEDYAKGAISQKLLDTLIVAAKKQAIPVAMDPKDNPDLLVKGLTVVTPNRKEAFQLARLPERQPAANPLQDEPLLKAAQTLQQEWQPKFLVVTLGSQGMLLLDQQNEPRHIPTVASEVFDVSGAGDTVIAALLLALAAGAGYVQAAELANCAAGVVVSKLGTAGCTAQELLAFMKLVWKAGKLQ